MRTKCVRRAMLGLAWATLLACNRAPVSSPPGPESAVPSHLHAILEPGRQVEINFAFEGPNEATATFKAETPLEWNVHSHPDGGMVVHQHGLGADGSIVFRAQSAGTYSFKWSNTSAGPVALDVDVSAEPGVKQLGR